MKLSDDELVALVEKVFEPSPDDGSIVVLIDVPATGSPDTPRWKARREMAVSWARQLAGQMERTGLEPVVCFFGAVGRNNAELPAKLFQWEGGSQIRIPSESDDLPSAKGLQEVSLDEVLSSHPIFIAPTQFSATAPLKLAGRKHGIRAATMPGFDESMIPALKLDYAEIGRRVDRLTELLDEATEARLVFNVDDNEAHHLTLDLRHRRAHASGGRFPEPGMVGNLPSGEAYIVPYEGERSNEPSRTEGHLPVQFGSEVVVYDIIRNRAIEVISLGEESTRESRMLADEPAYGNMAELGLGVLADFGLEPVGEILIDEKLGLHIAFGRSDHFGGHVGPRDFADPRNVVHIDRVYVQKMQPKIDVLAVDLVASDGGVMPLMRNGRYVLDFGE
jgi:hypothetical protein